MLYPYFTLTRSLDGTTCSVVMIVVGVVCLAGALGEKHLPFWKQTIFGLTYLWSVIGVLLIVAGVLNYFYWR
jgi:hypothetical protein